MAAGDLGAALAAVIKGLDDPSWITRMPRFILEPVFRVLSRVQKSEKSADGPSVAELIPTMHYDMLVAREMAGTLQHYRAMPAEVLLLGGDRSRPFLSVALDRLESVLPQVSRVHFKGVGHLAPAEGAPERVAGELKRFFAAHGPRDIAATPRRPDAPTPRRRGDQGMYSADRRAVSVHWQRARLCCR
jgi:hypothetical protein